MTVTGLAVLVLLGAETLSGEYRAVTIEVGSRRQFQVPKLETITGSSGRCLDEGMDMEVPDAIWIEASCSGVRTSLVWKKDGSRVHVMACGEEIENRPPNLFKLRQKLEKDLKAMKSVTACVRNGRVELWGWYKTDAEGAIVTAIVKKHGLEEVRSFVEKLEAQD